MNDIELSVGSETDRLLQLRTGVVATVVLFGIVAGYSFDLVHGRFFDYPLRQTINLVGATAMMSVIVLSRRARPALAPVKLALARAFSFCLSMMAMSAEAGPEARMVVVLAYTVMNLGAATLLPWGLAYQAVMVGMVVVSTHGSFYILDQPPLLDSYVSIAMYTGLALSLFLAHYLERTRLLLVRERLRVATQKDLAEEQRAKAEALAKDLDAYAHAVAHDLKNPIQVIGGYTDLLEDKLGDDVDEEGREFLRRTAAGCAKMTQITNELLLLATVRKRGTVPREPIDMATVVSEARQRLAGMITDSGAEVLEPETWPTALGLGPWVEEIWANFISNAIKYGGVPPRLELGATVNGDSHAHFWVRDNGKGLDEAQVEHLYQECSRLSEGMADGHGLWLSIVKRIVEKLDGEASVESSPGHGSKFGFILPR